MQKKYAVIDIGTNSVRLMIADPDQRMVKPLYKMLETTRLGDGIVSTGRLSGAAIARTVAAAKQFYEVAQSEHVEEIFIFATSAARDAENQQEFIDALAQQQIAVDIVSGDLEAKLAALGALTKADDAVLIDIGGGSTEFVEKKSRSIVLSSSIPVGCVRAGELFSEKEEALQQLKQHFGRSTALVSAYNANDSKSRANAARTSKMKAKKLIAKLKKANGPVYAVGGTATTIASYAFGLRSNYDAHMVQGRYVTLAEIKAAYHDIYGMTAERRRAIPIIGQRADIIIFGVTILMHIIEELDQRSILISDSDNLEGYLIHKLGIMGGSFL